MEKNHDSSQRSKFKWGKRIVIGILAMLIIGVPTTLFLNPEILPRKWAYEVYKFRDNFEMDESYTSQTIDDNFVMVGAPLSHQFEHDGLVFADNMIRITLHEGYSLGDARDVIDQTDGVISGYSESTYGYVMTTYTRKTYDELESIAHKIEGDNRVKRAYPEQIIQWELYYTPNDKEIAGGSKSKTWHLEAINAYKDEMKYVNVGLIDGAFEILHEDIAFTNTINNPYIELPQFNSGALKHGTEVAGIMSAVFDNKIGVAGIAPKTTIRAGSIQGGNYNFKEQLQWLIDFNNSKAVSLSIGSKKPVLDKPAQDISDSLLAWAEQGKDFVIVKAAGNTVSDAKHDFISNIEIPTLKDRIIVVGAVDKDLNMWYESPSKGSDYGERIDVVAPGVEIYSTTPSDFISGFKNYSYDTGTSFAAPQVSGVAASLFGLSDDITGAQVKQIICETASKVCHFTNGVPDTRPYRLLDAGAAVDAIAKAKNDIQTPSALPKTGVDEKDPLEKFMDIWITDGESTIDFTDLYTEVKYTSILSGGQEVVNRTPTTDVKLISKESFQFGSNNSEMYGHYTTVTLLSENSISVFTPSSGNILYQRK